MKVYYLTADNGDGSSSVDFFEHEGIAQQRFEDNEEYWGSDGVMEFEIPDGQNTIQFSD